MWVSLSLKQDSQSVILKQYTSGTAISSAGIVWTLRGLVVANTFLADGHTGSGQAIAVVCLDVEAVEAVTYCAISFISALDVLLTRWVDSCIECLYEHLLAESQDQVLTIECGPLVYHLGRKEAQ